MRDRDWQREELAWLEDYVWGDGVNLGYHRIASAFLTRWPGTTKGHNTVRARARLIRDAGPPAPCDNCGRPAHLWRYLGRSLCGECLTADDDDALAWHRQNLVWGGSSALGHHVPDGGGND